MIIATLGVPGALVGGVLVETKGIGRKGALAVSTILTGVFLYASTTALNSQSLLGWNCAFSFCSNVMYAVLYGFTPELFPTPQRGTGNALTATCNRVFGIMAVLYLPDNQLWILKTDIWTAYRGHVCRPQYRCTGLHQWSPVYCCRSNGSCSAIRVEGKGSFVNRIEWLCCGTLLRVSPISERGYDKLEASINLVVRGTLSLKFNLRMSFRIVHGLGDCPTPSNRTH